MRAAAQRLTRDTAGATRPSEILHAVCGLQAQLLSAAALGMRARSAGLHPSDVDRALGDQRSIVRTWLMRGTLHVIEAEDLGWLLGLLGPIFAGRNLGRHAELGLDAYLKVSGVQAIRRILAETGPLTRYELVDHLGRRGITLDPRTQAPIHLIQVAALQGVLCHGPERDKGEPTYVLIEDWVGRPRSIAPEAALGELARRYFAAYGPATVDDLATWSGIPTALARRAVSLAMAALTEAQVRRKPAWLLKGRLGRTSERRSASPSVRLLPAFDTYLLGYRSRDLAVPPRLQRRLQRGGGWLHPAVVVDGRAAGAWQLRRTGRRNEVVVEPLAAISSPIRAGIEAEISDIGRFLQLSLTLVVKR